MLISVAQHSDRNANGEIRLCSPKSIAHNGVFTSSNITQLDDESESLKV